MLAVIDVLKHARELVARRWIQGCWQQEFDDGCDGFCAAGAILFAEKVDVWNLLSSRAIPAFNRVAFGMKSYHETTQIVRFNDVRARHQRDVLKLFDDVISVLEMEEMFERLGMPVPDSAAIVEEIKVVPREYEALMYFSEPNTWAIVNDIKIESIEVSIGNDKFKMIVPSNFVAATEPNQFHVNQPRTDVDLERQTTTA